MSIGSVASLVDALRQHHLLEPGVLDALSRSGNIDPRTLARQLMERGQLTAYQVNQLFLGRAAQLALGSYVLLERLGEGGMGEVFKARNWKLDRIVAIKLMRKERLSDPAAVRRFQREARAASQLFHPNIVHAFDADQIGETHTFVMEYVEGIDLARLVKENGPVPIAQTCDYIRQAALGLQHAHEKGMIHRDIKPSNLLLTKEGVIKILDLGLARSMDVDEDSTSQLTQEGVVIGTLDYLAPEQAQNSRLADIRSDLYSLGCTFYFLLTGKAPYGGGSPTERLLKHRLDEVPAVEKARPEVPADLAAVVGKLMAKRPEDRYQKPADLAAALTARTGRRPNAADTMVRSRAADAVVFEASETIANGVATARVRRPGRNRLRFWLLGALVLLGLGAVGLTLLPRRGQELPKTTEPGPFLAGPFQMKMTLVPAGTFAMGSSPEEIERVVSLKQFWPPPHHLRAEGPQHEVEISQPFYLGIHKVTRGQFRQFLKETGHRMPKGAGVIGPGTGWRMDIKADWENPNFDQDDTHPVVCVSWSDAQAFLDWLNTRYPPAPPLARGRGPWRYTLPTEAQWEYACRAGTKTRFFCGDSDRSLEGYANICDESFKKIYPTGDWARLAVAWNDQYSYTSPVGSFKPNRFGLFDMHGNAWEWCADRYDPAYYRSSPKRDPPGPSAGNERVVRGGSWRDGPVVCRSAFRISLPPEVRHQHLGFRVACGSALGYELQGHPPNAVAFNGRWYTFFPEKVPSWSEARRRCQDLGGYLACIRSPDEHQFAMKLSNRQNAWLGGYNNEKNQWLWITGEPIASFFWAPGQPNNGANVFLQLGPGLPGSTGDKTWHDIGPGEQAVHAAGFICMWDF